MERLDVTHYIIYTCSRNEELHRAPLTRTTGDPPHLRILDVGCGTGIWGMEMAEYVCHLLTCIGSLT